MPETERFDKAAATWEGEERRVLLASGVTEAIARRCALPADLDVLDFGCGTGLVSLGLLPAEFVSQVSTPGQTIT